MTRSSKDDALVRLRAWIEAEGLSVGDRLPAERRLASRIGCSRETLRAALDRLEAEGEIWRHVGQGTFLGRRPAGRPLRDRLLIEATSPRDLMDARLLLEPQVAAAAARRAGADDIGLLEHCVSAGRTARDRAGCEQADSAFHGAVAGAARNPVLGALLSYLSDARRRAAWQREWDRTYRRIGVTEFTGLHSDQHAEVVAAIARRDAAAAEAAMRRHLETIDAAISGGQPSA
ncbi:FadR/GntR family transcriptional regulator [Acidimangrovimonas pyrenivorans]|uniref:FadR/GntR family transcriptional regulator n=1 Tax=Acidimangrovimonas pyrenivorans TaxID=2030798 RepID=A0ABV7AF02_9RHOB